MSRRANICVALLVLGAAAAAALFGHGTGDYGQAGREDDAAPALQALLHGDLGRYAAVQPLMGSFSLLLRAPLAGLAQLLGGDAFAVYRAGALACLLAAALLGLAVARLMVQRGRSPAAAGLVALICAVNPATLDAVRLGHPEEVLCAALCVGAVVVAGQGRRPLLAGLLLGAAIGTKPWALLAVPAVLLAAPDRRARLLLPALGAGLLLTAPVALANLHRFLEAARGVGRYATTNAASAWWPVSSPHPERVFDTQTWRTVVSHQLPGGITRSTVGLVVMAAVAALAIAYWRRLAERGPTDALALLALGFLVRCFLEPLPLTYNYVPLILALAAWEGLSRRRTPVVTLAALAAVGLVLGRLRPAGLSLETSVLLFASLSALAAYLGLCLYRAPGLPARARAALRPRAT
jgi:hypothetical protein